MGRWIWFLLLSGTVWAGPPAALADLYRLAREVVVVQVTGLRDKPGTPHVEFLVEESLRGSTHKGWNLDLLWTASETGAPEIGSRWILVVHLAPPNGPDGSPSWQDVSRCRLPDTPENRTQVDSWLKS
ncbi:hypothetical protein IV102_34510 [bacterium]|nr:hypothetical protein [bacterium]